MKPYQWISILLLFFLLPACMTMKTYQVDPSKENVAFIRAIGEFKNFKGEPENEAFVIYKGAEDCSDRHEAVYDGDFVTVSAEKKFAATFHYIVGSPEVMYSSVFCPATIRFDVEANAHYIVKLEATRRGCVATVYLLQGDDEPPIRVSNIDKPKWKRGFSDKTSWCTNS
ncbi:MAG: hypothetical protein OEZ58_20075 [Gammaproteobacteria bacterium]|nr:hypothetical protein [Gammaproteobacteria bacterium]MDH5731289.1 hypothetical protein [Gammaproteobacteria bacterium]